MKITVDLNKVGRIVKALAVLLAVLIALMIGNSIVEQLYNIAKMLLYLVQFMSKSVGA